MQGTTGVRLRHRPIAPALLATALATACAVAAKLKMIAAWQSATRIMRVEANITAPGGGINAADHSRTPFCMTKSKDKATVSFVTIGSEMAERRLDNFLLSHLKGLPRSRIYRMIRSGEVRINRRRAKPGYRLNPGDVLVADTTSPPWTPLFSTAAAIVTDTGGILSHCAVVAREYRIPAVVGTGTATTVFTDGQILEVDGDNGIIKIVG